ncbi:hypothetical protein OUZ56_012402 [Daphnia magna]|uniref:HAT C-terminal dimerisation domain-containing protein n=1 Tax=Daphnia magna TaxID=35525 RepID=A0ABQ9Z2W4_9CRUS|nr:hypothetical protein OUZ56_012402 [Daphnia magna]
MSKRSVSALSNVSNASASTSTTSVVSLGLASERAFSTGKDVFGIARMSLHPKAVEALVCLRSWYKAGLVGEVDVVKHYEDDVDHASAR